MTSNQVAADAYLATNTMGRLLRSTRSRRRRLAKALLAAADAVVAARLALSELTALPGRDQLAEAAAEAGKDRLLGPRRRNDLRLPRLLHWAIVAVTFVVDVSFFYTLYADLWGLPRSEVFSMGRLGAVATALITPLAVIGAAEAGGRWLAHRRYRPAAGDGEVPGLGTAGPVCVVVVPLLSVLFYAVAWYRFDSESSGFGGAEAPVELLAVIFALLPLLALLTATTSTDPWLARQERILKEHRRARRAEARALVDVRVARTRHWEAWLAMLHAVVRVVDRGNLAIQHWEHLVLSAYAETGRAGDAAPLREDVVSGAAAVNQAEITDPGEQAARTGRLPLPLLTQLRATLFACPPWVVRELAADLQLLAAAQPDAIREEDRAVSELVALLASAMAGEADEGPGAEDPGPKLTVA
ncbi:hypothetical protein [Blastococcus sp. SYSU DS1021]